MTEVVIYFESGGGHGMGHGVRCRHLAEVLRDAGASIKFVVPPNDHGIEYLDRHGHHVQQADLDWMLAPVAQGDLLIIDRMENDDAQLASLKQAGNRIVVMVGVGYTITRRTHWIADMVIHQAPESKEWEKDVPGERVLHGLEYLVVDPRFAAPLDGNGRDTSVVTYFGAGLPDGYAEKAVQTLRSHRFEVVDLTEDWVDDVMPVMRRASAFFGSMGMVAYDAMANGLKPLVVSSDEDHLKPAEMADGRELWSLGLADEEEPSYYATQASEMIRALQQDRVEYFHVRKVDGFGAYRVAREIMGLLE